MANSTLADGYGLFWNSEGGDRKYNAESFENWLRKFFTSGVFANDLQVVADTGMTVTINAGYANTNGKVGFFGDAISITLDVAHTTYNRIDTIVVERNDNNREITIHKVVGAYSDTGTPVPTPPVRADGVYQLVLAEIYVVAGVSEITQADITDKRENPDVCGYITGTVEEIDFSQITAQFESYYEQFRQQNLAEFDAWFQRMKDQLDEDAAGHLQNEVDALQSQIGDLSNLETVSKSNVVSAVNEVHNKVDSLTTETITTIVTTGWEANTDVSTADVYPYVYNISSALYSDDSMPIWDCVGTSATGVPTSEELEAIYLVQQAYFSTTGIVLYATDLPTVDIVFRAKGV